VYVEGKMRHSSYNKQDGTKVYTVAILAQSINLISTKAKKQEVANKEEQEDFTPTYEDRMIDVPDIDIPF
jgi:single-stranded DNA-binding protein